MPKVLRIINRFNLGGPTYNVAYLSKFMAPEYETILVGGMKDETEDSSEFIVEQLGLKPILKKNMQREINLVKDYKAYQEIREIIKTAKPDIVHTHGSKAGTLGRLAAKSLNVPIVIHTFHGHVFHSYFGKLKTSFYKTIERYLASQSTKIIAISNRQKEELVKDHKIGPSQKFEVIPLGFDLNRFKENQEEKRKNFRELHAIPENAVAIGIIGRLVPVKNHKLFLKAIKHVLDFTTQPIKAFIIGDGELMNNLKLEATRVGLGYNKPGEKHPLKHLHFTSWMHDVDVAYAGLDIITLTSFNEGTPVSLIEAQASGRPVISTNVGGIENIVAEGKTGYLVDVEKEFDFFTKLLYLVTHKTERLKMGEQGREEIIKKYSYDRLVNDMKNLYNSLLQNVR